MTIQITVIGLGQVGASIGLALAGETGQIKRVGHDRALDVQNKAKKMGAFDVVNYNLPSSVADADVVILSIPFNQVEETLKLIAPDLREDAVVMDFSPQKTMVQKWFEQYVPAGRHYVGLIPSINAEFLLLPHEGIDSARPDLFQKASVGIASAPGTPGAALQLTDDLLRLLGAKSIFLDMQEADGMLMMVHHLPQMMSVALLNATVGQSGWREAQRFASRTYAMSTAPIDDDPIEALGQVLLSNPAAAAHALNSAIGALTHLKDAVAKGDKADLEKRLRLAFEDRENWLKERRRAEWDETSKPEFASAGDTFKRIFLGDRPKRKDK